MDKFDLFEAKVEAKLESMKDEMRSDLRDIREDIRGFMTKVDNHIQQEESTILELRPLIKHVPEIITQTKDEETRKIIIKEKSEQSEEKMTKYFKLAKVYGAWITALSGGLYGIYYLGKIFGFIKF